MRRLFFKRLGVLGMMVMMMVLCGVVGAGLGGLATTDGEGPRRPRARTAAETTVRVRAEALRTCDADQRHECDGPDASSDGELELEAKPR